MQSSKVISALCAIVALGFLGTASGVNAAASADEAAAGGPVVTGTWEHHHASFTYWGITALYSCDALENNIRALLQHLGARKDATVNARGCPNGFSVPGHNAIVETDFYTLSPSADANAANSVQARWAPVVVSATRPYFMGHGDCELIAQLKDIITKNFSLRDLNYRTDCVPHQVNIDDFSIKAEALKPLPAAASASRG